MINKYYFSSLAAATVILTASPLVADVTLVLKGTHGHDSTIQVKNGTGRMSNAGWDQYTLFDTRTETMIHVDPKQQRYMSMTKERLEENMQAAANLQKSMAPHLEEIRAGLSELPEEQRKMIEQRMEGMMGAPAAGKPSDPVTMKMFSRGTDTIAGLECQLNDVLKDDQRVGEVCLATAASGKVSQEDFETLEAMMAFSRNMASMATDMMGKAGSQKEMLPLDLNGVPIAVKDSVAGNEYQVVSVSDEMLPDDLFSGYQKFQKQEMPSLK
jgi:hypothetical protein